MARAEEEPRAMCDLDDGLVREDVSTSLSVVKSTVSTTGVRLSLSLTLLSIGVCV